MALTPRAMLRAAALCAVAFAALLAVAYGWSDARRVDASALQGFLGLERPATEQIFDAFARLGDPLQVGLIGVALATLAVARGRPRVGLFVIALLGATSISSQALKALLAYPRYDGTIDGVYVSAAAFPSGHSTAAMAMAIALVVVMPSRLRAAAAAVGVVMALSISFSVVALGGHLPSDVVGGYLLATGWALVLLAGLRWAGERYPERTWRTGLATMARTAVEGLAAAGLVAALVAGTVAAAGLAALIAARQPDLMAFAQNNTAFLAVAGAIGLTAAALLGAWAGVLARRS